MNKEWKNIKISFGPGDIVPYIIPKLDLENEVQRISAYQELENKIVLQSDLYEGAFYVIDDLLYIAESSRYDKFYPLNLIYEIFNGYSSEDDFIILNDGEHCQLTKACRDKITKNLHRIKAIKVSTDNEHEIKELLIESIENPPGLVRTKEEIQDILKEIKTAMKK